MGSQSKAHPSEIPGYPTAHCPPSWPNQPSVGCRGQVAGAAPLGHEARTVGNLSSISSHLPTHFQLWQHWRIQAKEKKSWPLKVERHFRHWCRQLQQGPPESQQGLEGTAGGRKENVQTTLCKGERPSLAAAPWLVPATSACQKGSSPQRCIELCIDLLTGPVETQVCLMFQKCPFGIFFKTFVRFFPFVANSTD